MKIFLTLKHWQLFLLMIGIPVTFQFLMMGSILYNNEPKNLLYFFPILMVIYIGLFFGWFYALGTNLHHKLPENANMNLNRFKVFLFIPVVYMVLFCGFILSMFLHITSGESPNPAVFMLIIPFHLFSMFCIFYCLYFIAKALKTVECRQAVTFSDFAGEFFLIWFFPIGIWIIQPRINALFLSSDAGRQSTDE